jgi:hypothetical protein
MRSHFHHEEHEGHEGLKFPIELGSSSLLGANQVLTMIPKSEVGTYRRAVRGRLASATLAKADLRPSSCPSWLNFLQKNREGLARFFFVSFVLFVVKIGVVKISRAP